MPFLLAGVNNLFWLCIGQYMRLFTPVKIGTSIWWQAKQGGRVNRDFDYNSVVVVRNDCKKRDQKCGSLSGQKCTLYLSKILPRKGTAIQIPFLQAALDTMPPNCGALFHGR